MPIVIKSTSDIEKMRAAGCLVARVLARMREEIRPGATTRELDTIAHDMLTGAGASPSFLGYNGFPASICASIGAEIVHGFPSDRPLEEGEIVTIDVGAYLDGFHGDSAQTFRVGKVSPEIDALIETTEEAFWVGLEKARAGNRIGDVSAAIQEFAEGRGYGIIRNYGGHGIGRKMHEDPSVLNYGEPGTGALLQPGITFALEPMLSLGDPATKELDDGWTVVTVDGSPTAHYEHTVLVTDDEPELLTRCSENMV